MSRITYGTGSRLLIRDGHRKIKGEQLATYIQASPVILISLQYLIYNQESDEKSNPPGI